MDRTTLGQSLSARREAAGLSIARLTIEVCHRLPRSRWVTDETIRRYERDLVPPEKADPVLVCALADSLGCDVKDLSAEVDEATLTIKELLSRTHGGEEDSRCSSPSAGQSAGSDDGLLVGAAAAN